MFQLIFCLHRNHHQEASTGNGKGAIRDNRSGCDSSLRHQLGFKQDQVSHYHEHGGQVCGNEDFGVGWNNDVEDDGSGGDDAGDGGDDYHYSTGLSGCGISSLLMFLHRG